MDRAEAAADVRVLRLGTGEAHLAERTFALLEEVFGSASEPLSDGYLQRLLAREDFWALAAVSGDQVVGGITAHALAMTRHEARELFVYDLAVHPAVHRQGIGRLLVESLVTWAAADGISVVFVPADDDDDHALAFYTALGGRPAPVTMFDLGEEPPADG